MSRKIMQSPGVVVDIEDFSTYVSEASSCVLGIVGTSRKGPIQPTLVTSATEFVNTFGAPDGTAYGPYAAIHYLRQGNQVYYHRILKQGTHASSGVSGEDKLRFVAIETGTSGNTLSVSVNADNPEKISMDVSREDSVIEAYSDLSADSSNVRFIGKIINTESKVINVETSVTGTIESKVFKLSGGVDGGSYAKHESESITIRSKTFDSTLNSCKVKLSKMDFLGMFDYTLVDTKEQILEAFSSVSLDKTSPRYLPVVLEEYSNFISMEVATATEEDLAKLVNTTYTLEGGNDGTADLGPEDYIGDEAAGTGLHALSNNDVFPIDLLVIPGAVDPGIIHAGIRMCESRGDTTYIADVPYGMKTQDEINWTNAEGTWSGQFAPFDSSFVFFYSPWAQISDPYTGGSLMIPPSVYVAPTFAVSERMGGVGAAPAGLVRGKVQGITSLARTLSKGEADAMYGGRNIINPVMNFGTSGIVINGQKTALRTPSALDRINVRRMVNNIQRRIQIATRPLAFEPNDPITYQRWLTVIEPLLDSYKNGRMISDYQVKMDETTVSDYDRETGYMPGLIAIKPIKSAEFIPITIRVDNQSTSYDEE